MASTEESISLAEREAASIVRMFENAMTDAKLRPRKKEKLRAALAGRMREKIAQD